MIFLNEEFIGRDICSKVFLCVFFYYYLREERVYEVEKNENNGVERQNEYL